MKLKPCTATTELLQQTLLSENSPILANQSLVPLGLWYSSLTKSTQGLLRLAAGLWMACWDTSDGKARASSDPCYTLWRGLGARRKQSAWCLYLKSDLTDPGRHAENPQISFKGPNSIIWESKSGFNRCPRKPSTHCIWTLRHCPTTPQCICLCSSLLSSSLPEADHRLEQTQPFLLPSGGCLSPGLCHSHLCR